MEDKYNEINEEIKKQNNIELVKRRISDIQKDDFNFVISDSKISPKRKPYSRKKLFKLSSNSPLSKGNKFEMHYYHHAQSKLSFF